MLDTRVYEVEYLDVNKASIAANNIAENILSQVDEQGNTLVLFNSMVGPCVDGTETTQQDKLIVLNNVGKINKETTKGW